MSNSDDRIKLLTRKRGSIKAKTDLETLSEVPDEAFGEREQFEQLYYQLVAEARSLLKRSSLPALPPPAEEGSEAGSSAPHGYKHDFVRLPKINLPYFDGSINQWLEFRDTYLSLIHNNNSINDINKFHYLRASLKNTAALIIQSLDFRAENYAIAWQLLSDRYDNERLLINNHLNDLFNVKPIASESSSALRNIIDSTNKNLRALASLGQPTDHWDTLIIHIMSNKLDSNTMRQWEEQKNTMNSFPSLQLFLKFISDRADLLDTLHTNKTNNNTITFQNKTIPTKHIQKNNYIQKSQPNSMICPMCKNNHYLFTCQQFRNLSVIDRIQRVSQYPVCKNCLRPGHADSNCTLTHCKYCKLKHNTLLHNHSSDIPSDHTVSLSTNIEPASTSNSHKHVLLSTAMVKVTARDGSLRTARVLLDNGSTTNYVTQDLFSKLELDGRHVSSTVTVKAVHLELVTDLSKEAFLAALARFTARRGKPRCIHADNSTTFVGGFNELNSFLSNNSDAIQSSINEQEIQMEKLQRPAARRRPGSTEGRLTTSTPMAHGTRHCHRTIQRRPCKNCPSQHAKRTITPSISKLVLTT
ncbi:uncharacterized protein LOC105396586 isoform X3 [Plutella xylostella]|uniref:uncharacterized protein LOC105396586 isoform X3 n=1 Tax=Plutella xylostella TaxID=51655 RepID=UPI0020324955|nr:uncharacterized protein LOC105396586 isoform X3 [Plutella xylostella]